MKILQLNLQAFGPFTDEVLDLSGGPAALHIIFGPNEAGKSSALRALRGLFYGIESRSNDNFIHPHPKLRIGATLQTADGRTLELVRRKGNKNTLRDGNDDKPVDEAMLAKLLGGVDEASFARRYGIGYDDLVQGGRDIVSGGGDLGHSLFAAASGVANLSAAQAQLAAEAESLFLPSARVREINKSVSEFNERQKEIKDCLLPTAQWRQHDKALSDARTEYAKMRTDVQAKNARKALLQRIARGVPVAARRWQILSDLEPLKTTPLLREDFAEQHRLARTALEIAQKSKATQAEEITKQSATLDDLQLPADVLQHGKTVEQLQQRLGSHLKAMDDRRVRVAERNAALASAKAKLQELGRDDLQLEQAEQLQLSPDEHVRIANLGNEKGKLVARVEAAQSHCEQLEERRTQVAKQLADCPAARDAAQLRSALSQARDAGPLEKQLHELQQKQTAATSDAQIALGKLRGFSGTLVELEQLPSPADETIDRFEQQFADSQQAVKTLAEKLADGNDEAHALDEQIQQLRRSADVPTEEDLIAARQLRDSGWDLLRRQLAGDTLDAEAMTAFKSAFDAANDLPQAFAAAVDHADQIADRLRREAKQVAEKAQLLTRKDSLERRMQAWTSEQRTAEAQQEKLQAEWTSVWEPLDIQPLSPREMRPWLRQARELCEAASGERARQRELQQMQRDITEHREAIDTALQAMSAPATSDEETLSQLLLRAETVIDEVDEAIRQRQQLDKDQQQIQHDLEKSQTTAKKATDALSDWASNWQEAVGTLRLRDGAEPAEANAAVEAIKALLDHNKDAKLLDARIASIDRDATQFQADVRNICTNCAPQLADESVEQAVPQLADLLTSARSSDTKRSQVEQQLSTAEKRQAEAEQQHQTATAQLNTLCTEAGCPSPDDLPATERASQRRRELERDLHEKQQQLAELAAGQSLDEFLAALAESDPQQVNDELQQLQDDLDLLTETLSTLDQTIGQERVQIAQMDGNARAAQARQEGEQLLAKIHADAEQFARLHLAEVVLRTAIDRYRQRHQGPVLERASELFAALTLGHFSALRADLDDSAKPVLVGVRNGTGEAVQVSGMSEGTCDQLYLALRLASLETDLEHREPLPFIVDDVLIKFDDDRAAAALKALAALSEKTQVILFTHHEHLVDLAEATLDDEMLVTHRLDSRRKFSVAQLTAV